MPLLSSTKVILCSQNRRGTVLLLVNPSKILLIGAISPLRVFLFLKNPSCQISFLLICASKVRLL